MNVAVDNQNALVSLEEKMRRVLGTAATPENMRIIKKWMCLHCQEFVGEIYMVRDSIWDRTGFGKYAGVLHIPCIEKLIGRSLSLSDFSDSPINDSIRWGYQFGLRS